MSAAEEGVEAPRADFEAWDKADMLLNELFDRLGDLVAPAYNEGVLAKPDSGLYSAAELHDRAVAQGVRDAHESAFKGMLRSVLMDYADRLGDPAAF